MSNIESAGEDSSGARDDSDDVLPRVREGLPASYRMRADAHYVDLLTSRPESGRERLLSASEIESAPLADGASIRPLVESIARYGLLQPLLIQHRHGKHRLIAGHKRLSAAVAAGVNEIPCRLYDVSDEEATRLAAAAQLGRGEAATTALSNRASDVNRHAGADLEKALASLASCTDFVSGSDSELSRTVASTLLRAEVWRTACLLKATRVLRQEFPVMRSTLSIRKLIDQVVNGFTPERRLRMIEFDVKSALPSDGVMVSDERVLTIALSSAIRALLSVFGDGTGASVKISAAADQPGDVISFTVSQSAMAVPDAWLARAFDAEWIDRPGGQAAMVSMLAVRQSAELLGGDAKVAPAGRGAAIVMNIPGGI